jgi:hypothetical protein
MATFHRVLVQVACPTDVRVESTAYGEHARIRRLQVGTSSRRGARYLLRALRGIGFTCSCRTKTNGTAVANRANMQNSGTANSTDRESQGGGIPPPGFLDDFVLRCRDAEGVAVHSLEAGAALLVETGNSRYQFVVVDGPKRRVIVKGGAKFLKATPVRLDGATAGGSALKLGWILVGLQLQVSQGRRRIRLSSVRSVTVEKHLTSTPGPFATVTPRA